MKGSIRQRGKDSWEIRIYVGPGPDGRPKYRHHTIHGGIRDAENEAARLVTEFHNGDSVDPSRATVAEYLEGWIEDVRPRVSGKTWERYAELVRSHIIPAVGRHRLQKLRPTDIQSFYTEAGKTGRKDGKGGLSPQTVVHIHRLLGKALRDAVRKDLLQRSPVERVDPPRVERQEMKVLNPEQINKLVKAAEGTVFHIPVVLAVYTGMRRGEILGLKWSDISLQGRMLSVRRTLEQTESGLRLKEPKSAKSRRLVVLSSRLVEILQKHQKEQQKLKDLIGRDYNDADLVCAREGGSFIEPDYISDNFRSVVKRAGLPYIRFHDLRHTHATLLLGQGIHPKIVSERLGHSTISITLDTYSHVLPTIQKDAVDKFDNLLSEKE